MTIAEAVVLVRPQTPLAQLNALPAPVLLNEMLANGVTALTADNLRLASYVSVPLVDVGSRLSGLKLVIEVPEFVPVTTSDMPPLNVTAWFAWMALNELNGTVVIIGVFVPPPPLPQALRNAIAPAVMSLFTAVASSLDIDPETAIPSTVFPRSTVFRRARGRAPGRPGGRSRSRSGRRPRARAA